LEKISFDGAMQGRSLLPLVEGKTVKPLPLFSEFLIVGHEKQMVVLGSEKLIFDPVSGKAEYFDLISDPTERNNLAAAKPEMVGMLKMMLNEWSDSCDLLNKAIIGERQEEGSHLDSATVERLRALGYMQ
jgi:hypothetical protein